jgi:putative transposase
LGPENSKRRKRTEFRPIAIRKDAAQPFDDRSLTWNLDTRTVSVWTVAGRIKGIPLLCPDEATKLLASRKGLSGVQQPMPGPRLQVGGGA